MRRLALVAILTPLLCLTIGCSKLTRSKASDKIDAALKAAGPDATPFITDVAVPGYSVPYVSQSGDHFSVGRTAFDSGLPLENALKSMGYINVQPAGPGMISAGLHADATRIVTLTDKAGVAKRAKTEGVVYSSGFDCYPNPVTQCNLPTLFVFDRSTKYEITGISQDEIHARVDILIPWKMTPFGLELKKYVRPMGVGSTDWENDLRGKEQSGVYPSTILFQKFDDGWRIVDDKGTSRGS